ncbi:MAG TPA: homoserine kinase [Clostridia bacterium]|jgi:homoserine kinase
MIKIKVPATSANLGAGFDCMGLALDIYNEIYVKEAEDLIIETDDDLPKDKTNLVVSSMIKTYEHLGHEFKGVYIKQINNIPKTSGLGSSAACVVGGVTAANIMLGEPMSQDDIIDFCTMIDGHPDNVVPAILGGVTASVINGQNKVHTFRCVPNGNLKVAIAIADFPLHTNETRAILPKTYSREDLVYSLSRAVATFAALSGGEFNKLKYIIDDKIHTPYRKPLIKNFEEIAQAFMDGGAYGVFLSGAGPAIAAFVDNDFKPFTSPKDWRVEIHKIIPQGVTVEEV